MGATSLNFKEYELKCRGDQCCGGVNLVMPSILEIAELFRFKAAERMGHEIACIVESGSRCWTHNAQVGGAKSSRHPQGDALDIRPVGMPMNIAEEVVLSISGITGFGRGLRYFHMDCRPGTRVMWCYDAAGKTVPYFSL